MTFREMIALMASDIALKQQWFLKKDDWITRNVRVFLEPGTIGVLVYRFGYWARHLQMPVFKQLMMLIYGAAKTLVVLGFGIYLPSRLKVGRGFAIHNFSGIFLPRTTIGDNFIVFQHVTVGHLRGQGGRPPRIGSNVMIAAGATVLGDLDVGSNVVIGANSLVINNVPDGCTVIGVPARIVSRDTAWMEEKLVGKGDHW